MTILRQVVAMIYENFDILSFLFVLVTVILLVTVLIFYKLFQPVRFPCPTKVQSSFMFSQKMPNERLFVWVDQDVYQNRRIEMAIKRLRQNESRTLSMNDYDNCERWLMKYNGRERISLIASNQFGKKIVPHVHDLSSIDSIYMNFSDSKTKNKWTQKYPKVSSIELDLNRLKECQAMDSKTDRYPFKGFAQADSGFSKASSFKGKTLEKITERQQGT